MTVSPPEPGVVCGPKLAPVMVMRAPGRGEVRAWQQPRGLILSVISKSKPVVMLSR